ncbi:hypothetical protein C8R48DRAFT_673042 [Suillus tomentosus]|nr:hypothetical protein C8R48DRAFT_673042 [Suillus tomentosus]
MQHILATTVHQHVPLTTGHSMPLDIVHVDPETILRASQSGQPVVLYKCQLQGDLCGLYVEGTTSAMSAHLRSHGITGPDSISTICTWAGCSKTLKKGSMKRHLLTHLGVKSVPIIPRESPIPNSNTLPDLFPLNLAGDQIKIQRISRGMGDPRGSRVLSAGHKLSDKHPLTILHARRSPESSHTSSTDLPILPTVTSQRDRFRQRNAELEENSAPRSNPSNPTTSNPTRKPVTCNHTFKSIDSPSTLEQDVSSSRHFLSPALLHLPHECSRSAHARELMINNGSTQNHKKAFVTRKGQLALVHPSSDTRWENLPGKLRKGKEIEIVEFEASGIEGWARRKRFFALAEVKVVQRGGRDKRPRCLGRLKAKLGQARRPS